MIKYSKYNNKTRTDQVWYENSSTIYYSEFIENENDNFGKLYVTFKNGTTYLYENVDMQTDYILFKTGGIEMSHGKVLNSRIKSKYEYKKLDNEDSYTLDDIDHMLETLKNNENSPYDYVIFISGHRDLTYDEFKKYYEPRIDDAIEIFYNDEDDGTLRFVIGDCAGCDIMAQDYLLDTLNYKPELITVYHCYDAPRYVNPKVKNLKGGFGGDIDKDNAMTKASNNDIAYVRNPMELSSTAQNILRRNSFEIYDIK